MMNRIVLRRRREKERRRNKRSRSKRKINLYSRKSSRNSRYKMKNLLI